jgi:hypothetical protein
VAGRLDIERLHPQPMPGERFADYEPLVVRVRRFSTMSGRRHHSREQLQQSPRHKENAEK